MLLAIALVILTGPGGQNIEINPNSVVSIREPRSAEHFAPDVKCLIHMVDGKVITVVDTCDSVSLKLQENNQE